MCVASILNHMGYAESEGKWMKKNIGGHVGTTTPRQSSLEKEPATEEVMKVVSSHTGEKDPSVAPN